LGKEKGFSRIGEKIIFLIGFSLSLAKAVRMIDFLLTFRLKPFLNLNQSPPAKASGNL
jgi:hypothetical protein